MLIKWFGCCSCHKSFLCFRFLKLDLSEQSLPEFDLLFFFFKISREIQRPVWLKGFQPHSSRTVCGRMSGLLAHRQGNPHLRAGLVHLRTQSQCPTRCSRTARLPVMVLGQVGDERYGDTHIDTCPDGDRQHCQEESPSGGGACQVEVAFRHRLVGLRGWEEEGVRKTQTVEQLAQAGSASCFSCSLRQKVGFYGTV